MTFEQYLKQYCDRALHSCEYRLVATVNPNGTISFYIHPLGRDGGMPSFVVVNNTLTPVVTESPHAA